MVVEAGASGGGVGVDDAHARSLCAGALGEDFLGLRYDLLIEEVDQLRLLRRGGIVDVVGDKDGSKARHSQRLWVEPILQVINFAVRHDGDDGWWLIDLLGKRKVGLCRDNTFCVQNLARQRRQMRYG